MIHEQIMMTTPTNRLSGAEALPRAGPRTAEHLSTPTMATLSTPHEAADELIAPHAEHAGDPKAQPQTHPSMTRRAKAKKTKRPKATTPRTTSSHVPSAATDVLEEDAGRPSVAPPVQDQEVISDAR